MSENPPLAVTSFGIYWDRDAEWNANKLYGKHLTDPAKTKRPGVINLAEQHAVYLLHHDREIVYVGQTIGPKAGLAARLREHTRSPTLHSRWNRFSWFGFREVVHDGSGGRLGEAHLPSGFTVHDLMSVVEAILIEAVEPRNNRQGGQGFNKLAYGPVSFAEAEKKMRKGVR